MEIVSPQLGQGVFFPACRSLTENDDSHHSHVTDSDMTRLQHGPRSPEQSSAPHELLMVATCPLQCQHPF
jgi:hypothetical protein